MIWWLALALLLAVLAAAGAGLALMQKTMKESEGVGYFGRTAAGREAYKETIARRARLFLPATRLIAWLFPQKRPPLFRVDGVTGPSMACSVGLFERTRDYAPRRGDVFVATQMKCGTTWMQQVAYEVLLRGRGDLGDDGHRHMYATSPWIESRQSVSLENAARLGDRGDRIIKTHMPTQLCPYGKDARYLYVTRHPVSCFASIIDFFGMLAGPFTPALLHLLDFYLSDDMYWRSWPEHVDGWWRRSREHPENVLFVHYETMLDDLPGVVDRVASLLEIPLSAEEKARVVHKSGFEYMKAHEGVFEMAPPSPFQMAGDSYLKSGRKDRNRDVGEAEAARIRAWCRDWLRAHDSPYPLDRFYPDVAAG